MGAVIINLMQTRVLARPGKPNHDEVYLEWIAQSPVRPIYFMAALPEPGVLELDSPTPAWPRAD
jgi:hypothetical protein